MAVISVSGMVGSGKTSLVKMLSELLDVPAMMEQVDGNPWLPLYYQDPERYGFIMQVHMLNNRGRDIKKAAKTRNAILDQDISADKWAFALTNSQMPNGMSEAEYEEYCALFDNIYLDLNTISEFTGNNLPDVNIILTTDMDRTRKNIRGRGREAETFEDGDETDNYFVALNDNFNEYAEKYDLAPKMVIDVTKLDFVNSKADKSMVLGAILEALYTLNLLTEDEAIEAQNKMVEMTTPDISTRVTEDGTYEITVVDDDLLSEKAIKSGVQTKSE
ncbi:deoxyadenosine kinase [Weissella phage PWc]|nr:deoxyadenosine kinase [Weissella phage PWc]